LVTAPWFCGAKFPGFGVTDLTAAADKDAIWIDPSQNPKGIQGPGDRNSIKFAYLPGLRRTDEICWLVVWNHGILLLSHHILGMSSPQLTFTP